MGPLWFSTCYPGLNHAPLPDTGTPQGLRLKDIIDSVEFFANTEYRDCRFLAACFTGQ
jgi:hypothetical protein